MWSPIVYPWARYSAAIAALASASCSSCEQTLGLSSWSNSVPTGLEPDAAAGSTLESAAAGDDEVTSRWAPSSWRQLEYNDTLTHGAAVEHEGGAHGALLLKGDVGLGAVLLDALELAAELGFGG